MHDRPPLLRADFVERYDSMILGSARRELYGDTGFYNVGYWEGDPPTLPEACAALVEQHIRRPCFKSTHAGWRVLDIGCGLGSGTALIAQRFARARVMGVNISLEQLRYARKHYPQAAYCLMDATRLALPDASIDAAISVEAAFHFQSRGDFLSSAYRVLKPDARLVLTDILFATNEWVGGWAVPEANAHDSLEEYGALCREHGFTVEALEDITASTWRGFCAHLRERAADGAIALDDLAANLERAAPLYLIAQLRKT